MLMAMILVAAMQPGASGEAAVAPVRIGGDIAAPKLRKRVETVPQLMRDAGIVGQVGLEATFGTDGHVHEIKVVRGVPLLSEAVVTAVRQWEYEPLRLNGVPTPFITMVWVTVCSQERARESAITSMLTKGSTDEKESMCLLLAEPEDKPAFAGRDCPWKPYRSRLSKGDRRRVAATLRGMVESEPSEGVRTAAAKALERLRD